jgi:hypothetical protein
MNFLFESNKFAKRLFISLFVFSLAFLFLAPLGKAYADYTANNLIDDFVYTNAGTMNQSQIQSFLSGKKGYIAGYNSWSSRDGGNVPASRIIYEAAQDYGINPQVILATLQKEEGLITDPSPNQGQLDFAMGYGCADSTGCEKWSGFFNQIDNATWQFRYNYEALNGRAYGNHAASEYPCNSGGNAFYSAPLRQGNNVTFYRNTHVANTINKTFVIANVSTASLYCYTPHAGPYSETGYSGSYNFVVDFEAWFGSTHNSYAANSVYAKSSCNIPDYASDIVGRLYHPERKDYLFTTNHFEACQAIRSGYIWDGLVFQNYVSDASTMPVYRLASYARHIYTSSDSVRQDYMNQGFSYEGVAFYAKTGASGNIPVYCLVNASTGSVTYTSASGEIGLFANEGYSNVGTAFYTGQLPNNLVEVYRLNRGAHRLYTTSTQERDAAQLFYGFTFENQFIDHASKNPSTNLVPVYRISAADRHFYTTNRGERDLAVVFYGYISEGTELYAYPSQIGGSVPEFRLTDSRGNRLFTVNSIEKQQAIDKYGYTSEGTGWYIND